MRFSENGYYLEAYEKCQNCGGLMYERGVDANIDSTSLSFCSEWCLDWFLSREQVATAPSTLSEDG